MIARARLKPRKAPAQSRSKETVEAILTAAAKLLVKEGFDRVTTNRIAEAAGVSIGSLYQYFPSKEALVAVLIKRHVEQAFLLIAGRLDQLSSAPLEQAARELIELMIDVHRQDPELHRVFVEQMPKIAGFEHLGEIDKKVVELVRAHLELHRHQLRVKNLDLAAVIVTQTVEALTHGAVLSRPQLLDDPSFVDELTDLVVRYLLRAAD